MGRVLPCPKVSFAAGSDRIQCPFLSKGPFRAGVGQDSGPFPVRRSTFGWGWTGFRAISCPKASLGLGLDRIRGLFLSKGQSWAGVGQKSSPFPVRRPLLSRGCACRQRAPGGGQAEPELVFLQTCQKNNSGPPRLEDSAAKALHRKYSPACLSTEKQPGLDRNQGHFLSEGPSGLGVGQDLNGGG